MKVVVDRACNAEHCYGCSMARRVGDPMWCTEYNEQLTEVGDDYRRLDRCKAASLTYRICMNCRFFDYAPYVVSVCKNKNPETMFLVRAQSNFGCNFWEDRNPTT